MKFNDVFEFYSFIEAVITSLREGSYDIEAQRMHDAMRYGCTSGEVLGNIGIELEAIMDAGIDKRLGIEERCGIALATIVEWLGPRNR